MASLLKRRRLITTAVGAGLVIIATATLAGCGQAGTGGKTSGTPAAGQAGAPMKPAPVCASPAEVRSVLVTRLPTLTQLGQTKPLPKKLPGITVRDSAKARALARLVCSLPTMPQGVVNCPVAFGGGYQLIFMTSRLHLPAVTIRASGCETVNGAGGHRARWVARSPKFWLSLARLTGIQAPAHTSGHP
jgi:hypothetical protein